MLENNPLLSSYDLPPFSAIRAEHLVPAIEKIIADSRIKVAEIIVGQTPYPTWDDLVLAMDEVKARLDDTVQIIDIVSSVMTQEAWAEAVKHCSGLVMAYKAQLAQSNELFELYQELANSQIAALFDKPRQRVLQKILREFRLSGIHLPPDQQQRFGELNSDINRQEREFRLRVQQSSNAWSKHIEDESQLAGLPARVKLRMANEAQAKNLQGWFISLSDLLFRTVMLHAEHRPLRKEVWSAYHSRASDQGLLADRFSNDDVLTSLLDARHEKAKLLGYENFAQLALEEQAAESTDQVLTFLRNVLDEQRSVFALEAQQLKELAAQRGITHLEPWDYEYLAEKIRQHAGVSQEELRAYFPLDTVLSRLCRFTQRLFGVELLERSDFDGWHEDVRLFEVREHEQTTGYLLIDPYRRELAGGSAETLGLRNRRMTAEGRPRLPIAVLRSKLTPGVGDKPCLLDHQQLRALLHEFGHCLQQLLTGEEYRDISGLDGLGHDTVEFAGQVLEQWCFSKEFLIWISSHYQTGEPIPADRVDRLMAVIRTQTSWTTANLLLIMLFDVEVHRTYGDGRSAQEVFDTLNTQVGHLQWPERVRPFNSGEFIASSYAARVYSYKWSGVLASTAFELFVSNGVFDSDTGRAFREAFLTHGDSRSLIKSLEAFLGAPYAGSLIPPPDAGDPPQADSATDPSDPLISQLTTSQEQMVRLNDAVPPAAEVATQYLNYWFRRTFPALASNVTVEELSVRTLRKEVIPQSERTPDGPAFKRTVADTVPLETLFWRAVAGKIKTRELFLDMDNIEIVNNRNNAAQVPAALNSRDAKEEIKWLLNTTPVSYEPLVARALDDFWDKPADLSQDRNVSDWLVHEFGTQLRAQADLHKLDTTLSPQLHKAVTDYALSAPDAASRAGMADRDRPGVYSLRITPEGWGFSVPVPGAVALTRHDNAINPGGAVLYRPGNPVEVYGNLTALKASLKEDGNAEDEVNIAPMAENFLARLVTDLREAQKTAVNNVLLDGPAEGEEVTAWVARMDAAGDIGEKLDLASAMDERELQLNQKKLYDWLRGNPHVTGGDRVAWWKAVQDLQKTMVDTSPPPPDPVTLATPDALRDRTRTLLASFIEEKYAPADPDQVFLSIKREIIDPRAPTGSSPWESGISQGGVKGIVVDRRAMTEWAMSNLTPDERNALNPLIEGPLSYAQIKDVIERADVGARLPAALRLVARERQAAWMSLKEKQMRAQAWGAHISGDFRHDRNNTGLNLVLAALDSPTPAGRRRINGHEVEVRQLRWGNSVLKEVLTFGVKTLASRPSLTLYTPTAPDGKMFRDVDAGSTRELETALVQALTATPEMTRWLISQLPLLEQAEQLASLVPTPENLTLEEKIKKVTQSIFSAAKDRAQNDFALKISSPVVEGNLLKALHETQITHAIKTADMLTVTNAERDSAAAQEGRRSGVMLLTGAMSIFPVGRMGGILGRAVLPVMAGGAAVSAINDEGGSFNQWMSDFVSGLGEVLTEAGEDLIMARAGRRRGTARPALSSLPRMADPELEPFRLRGFDGKGLVPEGRNRYRDTGGQGYLQLGKDFYKSAMQGGERIIYSPHNRTNQRTVAWENGRWKVEERQRLLGGGAMQSLFRTPEPPELKKYNVLVEGILVKHHRPSAETVNTAKDTINSMPDELAERILNESIHDSGLSDTDSYRSRISELSQGRSEFTQHQTPHKNLMDKYNIWKSVRSCTSDFEANVPGLHFTNDQKIKIFDTLWTLRKELYDSAGTFKTSMTTMPDNFTGATFITITPGQGRKKSVVDKMKKETNEMLDTVDKKAMANLQAQFPGKGRDFLEKHLSIPENFKAAHKAMLNLLREEMKTKGKPGLLTEIRNRNIPYIIANKGKSQRKLMLTTGDDINNFTSALSKYTDPFDIEALTKVPSKPVTGNTPTFTETPDPTGASPATDRYTVSTSPLAETQMSYDNFPEAASTKITEIMEDIRAGRATTKRINGYYWYDMAQLSPGGGRGAWRAAFERKGDTWILQGFYDYHTPRSANVWEG